MMMNKMRLLLVLMLVWLAQVATAQDNDENMPVQWYLGQVVGDVLVGENAFDYYYTPSASDMKQQRARGEVTYFLNTPPGLNSKKSCALIDDIMASLDDAIAMNNWQTTATTCWKEFAVDRNKVRFSVKTKALDDGTYYVSVTETANYYKHSSKAQKEKRQRPSQPSTTKRGARSDRKAIVDPDDQQSTEKVMPEADKAIDLLEEADGDQGEDDMEVEAIKRQREEAKRLEKEKARADKEAAKLRKAQEKKAKQEQEALKKEQERQLKEQEKLRKQEERQRQEAERQQQELAREEQKKERQRQAAYAASKYHYSDVALWLSDKYDFTQTAGGEKHITMYSLAIKDVEMAKLTIKNALKGSNARMAMPWRVNSHDGSIETGYSVDGHALVFAIGTNDAGNITLTITEMDNEEFENFRLSGL